MNSTFTASKKRLITGLGIALLSLPASAANPPTQSMTKTAQGLSYKLTMPKPLNTGEHKLSLKINRGTQLVRNATLSAQALMEDGMKSAVKITLKPNGEYELKTQLDMGGEWQLKIQQTAPVKTNLLFLLDVNGNSHHHH